MSCGFTTRDSSPRCPPDGVKRLAKVEVIIERKKKVQAQRYNKNYPGEMIHFDTKRLPFLKGETKSTPRDYLFFGIDDFSRELYAAIMPDKTQGSSGKLALHDLSIFIIL